MLMAAVVACVPGAALPGATAIRGDGAGQAGGVLCNPCRQEAFQGGVTPIARSQTVRDRPLHPWGTAPSNASRLGRSFRTRSRLPPLARAPSPGSQSRPVTAQRLQSRTLAYRNGLGVRSGEEIP